MSRQRLATWLIVLGLVLLVIAVGQYAYMGAEQRALQVRWARLNRPDPAAAAAVAATGARNVAWRLVIPSIRLNDAVVRGTAYEDLLVGPGWLEGSPAPGQGNTVIAGHRDTFFRHVAELQLGDEILVQGGGKVYGYRVAGRSVVKPTETQVLDNTAAPRLTLVTCYPTYWIGPAPDRLIVVASLESVRPLG